MSLFLFLYIAIKNLTISLFTRNNILNNINKNYVTIISILLKKKLMIKGKYVEDAGTGRVLDGNLVEVKCHHQINCSLL